MRIHYFQHVPFEGLGNIEEWINAKGYPLSSTRFYEDNVLLPKLDDIDWLIIMGGPMGAYEENIYPWLAAEKRFIGQAISRGTKVLGICLGAQLIAAALDAKVYPNTYKEIGWFTLNLTKEGIASALFRSLPSEFVGFHWHGDTFDLPTGAKHLAESVACRNQAFSYKNHVLALQFHLDVRRDSIEEWVQSGAEELIEAPYIQTAGEMLSPDKRFAIIEKYMGQVLDRFAAQKR
jgi:GMP synthase - Glutamine amidotransferase domain